MAARVLRGVAAAPGIAAGKVRQLGRATAPANGTKVPRPKRFAEVDRAARALEAAATEVEQLTARYPE